MTSAEPTVADLLARCLRTEGVGRAFRAPGSEVDALPGIDVIDVPGAEVAAALADAAGRTARPGAGAPGVALLPGRRMRISSQPAAVVDAHPVADAEALTLAVAGWDLGVAHAALELDLDLDLSAPAPTGVEPLDLDLSGDQLITLSPTLAGVPTAIVVGPGVVRAGHADGVRELARRTGAGVVATWGAVGVLPADDPAWLGTVGLQAGDVELTGIGAVQILVVAGLDDVEVRHVLPGVGQVLEAEPWHLGMMAAHWPDPERSASGSALTAGLAALDPAVDASSLAPAAVLADLVAISGPDGLIAADPGPAGLWLARGQVVGAPAQVVVPALAGRGFAAAAALVAGLDGRRAVGVTTAPTDALTDELMALAGHLDVPLVLETWGADASWSDPAEHGQRLEASLSAGGGQRLAVPVDLTATLALVELAGEVVAWTDRG